MIVCQRNIAFQLEPAAYRVRGNLPLRGIAFQQLERLPLGPLDGEKFLIAAPEFQHFEQFGEAQQHLGCAGAESGFRDKVREQLVEHFQCRYFLLQIPRDFVALAVAGVVKQLAATSREYASGTAFQWVEVQFCAECRAFGRDSQAHTQLSLDFLHFNCTLNFGMDLQLAFQCLEQAFEHRLG